MASTSEQKIHEVVDNVTTSAQQEIDKLKTELDDLRTKSKPKIKEAETFLTSPSAIGFYQGLLVGVVVTLSYAKYKGGLAV
ncbi:hypothetical protein K501DRAFT_229213 [Backusella circina FSU 941]|nr:hypothetical protein K501DRAFT_229213 [Backusella circina FSU 941]